MTEDPGSSGDESAIFSDAASASGLDFVHFNGKTGAYLLPEVMGSGGALFDYDNDGDLDLYVVQGATLTDTRKPGAERWTGPARPRDRLFRNRLIEDRSGPTFEDVTGASGIEAFGYGMGVATGDYNNDGWTDLYVTNLGSNQLFRNNGDGTFSDATASSRTDDPRWSTSATLFDYDRDGWLDLFFTNYVDFSLDKERQCFTKASARDYCGPDAYEAVPDRLFRNRRDGTFEDVTERAGLTEAFGAGLGVVAVDINRDGWTDLYVANDGDPNQLWINQRKGRFQDEAVLAGVAFDRLGHAEAGMGVDAGDYDADGDDDLFVTNLDGESATLYMNLGDGFFEDRTIGTGLHQPTLSFTGFGTGFFDFDNDGWLDLVVANGAVRLQEHLVRAGDPYPLRQRKLLFRNTGRGRYEDVSADAGPAFALEEVSRGTAFGDIDNDGDTDLVIFNNGGRARLLLNNVGSQQHWLGLRVMGESGAPALLARVSVRGAGGVTLSRRVHTDGSYCAASDPRVLFGLGTDATSRTVRVEWPDGRADDYPALAVDRYWTLRPGRTAQAAP